MGYRSQVGLCIDKAVLAEAPQSVRENLDKILEKVAEDDEAVLYHHDYIKWYEDEYIEVKSIMWWIRGHDEDWPGYDKLLFIRVGEGEDDVEYHGQYWENPFSFNFQRELTYRTPGPNLAKSALLAVYRGFSDEGSDGNFGVISREAFKKVRAALVEMGEIKE